MQNNINLADFNNTYSPNPVQKEATLSFQFKRLSSDCRPKFSSLTVFGDSLSDTGRLSTLTYNATGGLFWAPPSPPLPILTGPYSSIIPYFNSQPFLPPTLVPKVRASDGPIWADYLPKQIALKPCQVSNFAFAGATTGFDNGLQPFLTQPIGPLPPTVQLPGLQTEVNRFTGKLPSQGADSSGLYVVWAGANDGFNLAGSLPTIAPQALPFVISNTVKTAVKNIEKSIIKLAHKGAKTFLVPNLPNLGETPLLKQTEATAQVGELFSLAFNHRLSKKFNSLERVLNIDIVPADILSLSQVIFEKPGKFGFKNVTDPLIAQDPNGPLINPEEFFWYDYQHPTSKVQELIADFFKFNLHQNGYDVLGSPTGNTFQNNQQLFLDVPQSEAKPDGFSKSHLTLSKLSTSDFLSDSVTSPSLMI
jgi:phospholipase/lecithinase/hemolysin